MFQVPAWVGSARKLSWIFAFDRGVQGLLKLLRVVCKKGDLKKRSASCMNFAGSGNPNIMKDAYRSNWDSGSRGSMPHWKGDWVPYCPQDPQAQKFMTDPKTLENFKQSPKCMMLASCGAIALKASDCYSAADAARKFCPVKNEGSDPRVTWIVHEDCAKIEDPCDAIDPQMSSHGRPIGADQKRTCQNFVYNYWNGGNPIFHWRNVGDISSKVCSTKDKQQLQRYFQCKHTVLSTFARSVQRGTWHKPPKIKNQAWTTDSCKQTGDSDKGCKASQFEPASIDGKKQKHAPECWHLNGRLYWGLNGVKGWGEEAASSLLLKEGICDSWRCQGGKTFGDRRGTNSCKEVVKCPHCGCAAMSVNKASRFFVEKSKMIATDLVDMISETIVKHFSPTQIFHVFKTLAPAKLVDQFKSTLDAFVKPVTDGLSVWTSRKVKNKVRALGDCADCKMP